MSMAPLTTTIVMSTTTLFAALDVFIEHGARRQQTTAIGIRNSSLFCTNIDTARAERAEVHLIADNYRTHKYA